MSYDIIPSEILLESFRRLDCKERVRAKIVCKEWLKIIDENRSLWRSLDCSIDINDETEPKILIYSDQKSQSTLEDVSIHMTNVTTYPRRAQEAILNTLFNTLEKSNKTLQTVILKAEYSHRVEERASELLLNCPKLNTFMFFDPRYFRSKIVILPRKVWSNDVTVEKSKLRVLWTALPINPTLKRSCLLENLTSLAVEWFLSPSEWRELLQASAGSFKHLRISIKEVSEEEPIISTLNFPCLKVLELNCYPRFPEWMIFSSTTILVLRSCSIKENLPSVNELWVSWLHEGLNLGKCCPSLRELGIQLEELAGWHQNAVLGLLHERKKQSAIGFKVAGVEMVPLKKIVLSFKNCESSFLDEVRELVEEVVDLAEVPNKIPVYL